MIGKLSSTIKSRRYPEENLLNRYLRRIATIELGSDDAEEDADDDDEHNHPLIVPRSIIDRAHVSWPPRKSGKDRASKDGLAPLIYIAPRRCHRCPSRCNVR